MRAVSVVIPALNEERAIGETLDSLACVRGLGEMMVVDGGSSDATVAIAESQGARAIPSERGRGVQLHAGALASAGDVRSRRELRPRVRRRHAPRPILDARVPVTPQTGPMYGDSGIFVRRAVYEAIGGFKAFPIFEDLDLIKRIKKRGRFVHLDCTLTTSSRRFEGRSFTWTFTRWMGMQVLYWAGVHPNLLARIYAPIRERAARHDSPTAG